MKNTIYILIIMFFAFNLNAQNIKTEIKYLKSVNLQSKELIEDNLRNAELVAYKAIQKPDLVKNDAVLFFKELAKSYFITEKYEFVLLTYYRQRYFFPEVNDGEIAKYYKNSVEKIRKNNYSFLLEIFKETSLNKIPETYNKRFIAFLQTVYKSGFNNADMFEQKYTDLYINSLSNSELPYYIEQENFYSKIGIKPSIRKKLYSFYKKDNALYIPEFLSKKQKKIICHEALEYYIHSKNKTKVKEYVSFCKKNKLPICLRARFVR